jgi:hypothetical protein
MAKKKRPRAPKDIAILHGPTEDGQGARMLRFKEGEVFAGEVRPAREGQPVEHQELVRLRPLDARYPICEVETLYAPPAAPGRDSNNDSDTDARRDGSGPARVSNGRYRRNWTAVFGVQAKTKPKRPRDDDWSVN